MACCSCPCRKPRHVRLVDGLFPEDPNDSNPVSSDLDKLLYFARSSPEHLDRTGEHLALRLRRSLNRNRLGYGYFMYGCGWARVLVVGEIREIG